MVWLSYAVIALFFLVGLGVLAVALLSMVAQYKERKEESAPQNSLPSNRGRAKRTDDRIKTRRITK